jgi:DNA-binding protein YbaB
VKEIKATAALRGVSVSVHPGGSLTDLALSHTALSLSTEELAATVLAAVAKATEEADRQARQALAAAGADLSVLAPVEEPEFTVPDTWRVS